MYIVEFPFIFFKKWHYSIFFITVREELTVLKKTHLLQTKIKNNDLE
jgi:hypothetical protein